MVYGSNWEAKKDNLKAKFASLTDEDLLYEVNQKDEMLRKLEIKLGMSPDELAMTIITL